MNVISVICRLHEHRRWVNRRLIEAAEQLPERDVRRSFSIGQGSVWQSLLHLYAAEYVWLAALEGDERPVVPGDLAGRLPGNQQGEPVIRDMTDLTALWQRLDMRWSSYLESLVESQLDETVYKVSTSSGAGKRFATRRADVLLHVCTHAQYTTAQVVNMLRQLGSPLPDVMLITLARVEA